MEEQSFTLPPLPSRATLRWIIGGFFVLTFAIYVSSLQNTFVRWDDGLLIYENPSLRSITPSTLKTIFTTFDPELYIPLTFFTYQIDYLIGGTHATIYHIGNLLWHTLNALGVAWFAYLLSRKKWTALFCGLLFAVHPLHTEAVAWASARKDVLSTFFFLGSLLSYLHYRAAPQRKTYYLSLGTFALGLLAKVTVLTLPVVLLLIDWRERRKWDREMLVEKIPFFALTVAFGTIAWIGKTGVLASSSLTEKILMAPKSAVFYLQNIFVPMKLSVLYPFIGEVTLRRPDILLPLIAFLLLSVAAFASLKWTREFFFGIAFYFVTVSPTLFNFAKGDFLYFASDRYAYVPSIGILFLFTLFAEHVCERGEKRTRPCAISALLLLLVFSVLSNLQSRTWHDSESLFTHTLAHYPHSYVALNNLGNVYRSRGEEEKAVTSYKEALSILEKYGRRGAGLIRAESKTLSNLASAEREQGDFATAEQTYLRALALNPKNEYALLGLGIIAGQRGDTKEAEIRNRQAIALSPTFVTARLNLGSLLVNQGRLEEGIAEYRTALDQNLIYPQGHFNLGVALQKTGKSREAVASYEEAIRLQPNFIAARINLGILLYNAKRVDEAVQQFEAVLEQDPGNRQATSALRQIQGSALSPSPLP
ncbi:MAG: tetratricopeptide repeat protein [Candidatus Peribacteraceae bacterium]|nr:tetratricopeptide repeat protein [Candidatus Peribacteraceae bacterium]MDD5074593.1 tetratricopeptide repeat protein [Candidatus Peribacteraceae bacterium]